MNLQSYHYVSLFRENVKKYADFENFKSKIGESWKGITWREFGKITDELSKALLSCDISPQDTVGIFSQNMPQWTIADIAILQIRAIPVPIYATNSCEQATYVVNHAEIKVLFVGDESQYDKAIEVAKRCPSLKKIVLFKDSIELKEEKYSIKWNDFLETGKSDVYQQELEKRLSEKKLSDLLTVIYTSGTTGEPKGVMLDYENFAH